MPANEIGSDAKMMRLSAVSARLRATLMREIGLSVETWSLPEWSRLMPDGKTCHFLVGLGSGIQIDGRALLRREATLCRAYGRPLDIVAERQGVQLLVAYPDRTPKAV